MSVKFVATVKNTGGATGSETVLAFWRPLGQLAHHPVNASYMPLRRQLFALGAQAKYSVRRHQLQLMRLAALLEPRHVQIDRRDRRELGHHLEIVGTTLK